MNHRVKSWLAIFGLGISVFAASLIVGACNKSDSDKRFSPSPKEFFVPQNFPEPAYDFAANPTTEQGFQLGRKLFWDNRLSELADVSCGSCHQQVAAFTTFDHDLGHGTNHQHTRRNVPSLFNLAWHRAFEWDGRITSLHDQCTQCLSATEKMGGKMESLLVRLKGDPTYKKMFGEAFVGGDITAENVSRALAQFVVMLTSANARYDQFKAGKIAFNSAEENGYTIFKSKCATCHTEPLFTDLTFRNNGLPENPSHPDRGRMEVSGNTNDAYKFKVPSLRNIGVTGYYGHDGRFPAFSQMLKHYTNGIVQTETLDPELKSGIALSEVEQFYLQEFLFTLTDSSLINNSEFGMP